MHKLLLRQIKRFKLKAGGDVLVDRETWDAFLTSISDSYHQADTSRSMVERSLRLMSDELVERNRELKEYVKNLQQNQDTIQFQAQHDSLTQLPNRMLFLDRLQHAIAKSKRESMLIGVLFIDLDHFKKINDTCGHQVGDEILCNIASRITKTLREGDTVARFGGDEFVVLLEEMNTYSLAKNIGLRILKAISSPYIVEQNQFHISASIGISIFPRDDTNPQELIRKADMAMYHAKDCGRNNLQFFSQPLERLALHEVDIENKLRRAIKDKEFSLVFQPIIETDGLKVVGFEALVRWDSQTHGKMYPAEFIPIAEKTGLIKEIGKFVVEQACIQLQHWLQQGFRSIYSSVNVSTKELLETELPDNIEKLLNVYGIPANMLQIEITETVMMENIDTVKKTLEQLRKLGLRIALDDFGTGYSSLSYLQNLPIDYLKIDKSFVLTLGNDKQNQTIANSIISLGHNMQMKIIAEGVETKEAVDILAQQECDFLQGYYFYKPLSADGASQLLQAQAQSRFKPARLDQRPQS